MSGQDGTDRKRPPIHYLRANESEWTPGQIVCFDTETRWTEDSGGETHVMRLWAARLDARRPDSHKWTGHDTAWGRTAGQLAAQLAEWCRGEKTVWAFAHNLSFDLTVSRLPLELGRIGWEVTDHAAGSETPWLRMNDGKSVLTLVDSWGWLRQGIKVIGQAVKIDKPPLPPKDAGEAFWRARCEADTEILAEAMLQILDWWDKAGLGKFSLTGSSSGWNVMRHKSPAKRIVIMPDETGIKADRDAIYGGRRECFTWGDQTHGPYVEHDFTAAYPTIAATCPLPSKRMFTFDALDIDSPLARGVGLGIIARVLIETDTPRWPCRAGKRVWYPAGRFWTTLAGPEIADARRLGALRAIGPGWAHGLSWALQDWARWVLDIQSGTDPVVPPIAIPMVKHWGRAVIGKFAARGFTKEAYGESKSGAWSYLPVWDVAAQAHGAVVELDGKRWKCLAAADGDNAYPAVLAYVESHTRRLLSAAIDSIGRGRVICCDTDGFVMRDRDGLHIPEDWAVTAPLSLRRKGMWRKMRVIGPQHIVRDGHRKYSGVPGSAVETKDGKLEALVWPRLSWQIREHQGAGYRRPVHTYTIGESYASGWVDDGGTVLPVQLQVDGEGHNRPVPWAETTYAAAGARLGPVQAPAVLRIFGMGG